MWAMPPWVPERIRSALPAGAELVVLDLPADGTGDGALRADPALLAAVEDADVYLGYGVPAEVLRRGSRLRWVHSASAGVGSSLTPEMMASPVLFTNSAGVHAPPMAETVLAMILHFGRGLDLAVREQALGRWGAEAFYAGEAAVTELSSATVGIVGFGGVGREVARRAAALGARVLATRRSRGAGSEDLETVGGGASQPAAARLLHGPEALARLLEESDYLVLAAPLTTRTRGILGREALHRMKPSAVVVNVSRGALVDEQALVEALREGRLRGAALDVFAAEPLPAGHPLWALPNVLLTPHVSAVTRGFWEREVELVVGNLRRLVEGRALWNLVDKRAGY